jgi:effector-binding domain-containing protein
MPMAQVPARFVAYLDEVYATVRGEHIANDGLNVFVYRPLSAGEADIEFGVGVTAPFASVGRVVCSEVPSGEVATTTHWGDYGQLRRAHDAIIAWCKEQALPLDGTRWEAYGHWSDDPAKVRTDIFYLLADTKR